MSPEAIERHRWSEKSDVWAFAVTVWEMFTHGKIPYTFIPSDSEVGGRCWGGTRLERPTEPTECPEEVFTIMQRCWAKRPSERPGFSEVKREMMELLKSQGQGECCLCLERMPTRSLLALVPCGHRCVCAEHAADVVGRQCPLCRREAREALRVFD
jgi:hypothetical protein